MNCGKGEQAKGNGEEHVPEDSEHREGDERSLKLRSDLQGFLGRSAPSE